MSQRPIAVKKFAGGRPVPKRLFSFDSLRKEKSASSNYSGSEAEQGSQNGGALKLVEKPILQVEENPFATAEPWTGEGLVTSPDEVEPPPGERVREKGRKKSSGKPTRLDLDVRSIKEVLAGSNDSTVPPPSPSRRRWDTIRTHVLPISPGAETPPRPSSPLDPVALNAARPSTPKGYRFGQKRNVRQVVDEARAVDEARKFADEIQRACWIVRFGAVADLGKPEREASQGTIGSGVHLPFMSSASSLPMPSSASIISIPMTTKSNTGPKRPPSLGSLALTNNSVATVTQVAKALTSTMSSFRPRQLPHERLVWSALMVPFLTQEHNEHIEAERGTAIETFQMAIKMWQSQSSEVRFQQ